MPRSRTERCSGMSVGRSGSSIGTNTFTNYARTLFRNKVKILSLRDIPKVFNAKDTLASAWDCFADNSNVVYADLSFLSESYGNRTLGACPKLVDAGVINAKTIGDRSLENCTKLDKLVLTQVTSIGRICVSCSSLRYVLIYSESVPSLNSSAFSSCNCKFYVLDELVAEYKSTTN